MQQQWKLSWALIGIGLVVALVGWRFGPAAFALVRDEARLAALLDQLGWFGPLVLIALNAAQIVLAPIPGYVIQAAAGYLYGPLWGGVWASLGQLVGSTLAMWLSRTYGRPLAEQLAGKERIAQWEARSFHQRSNSPLFWFILLLAPIGDLPYFLAGLSRISYGSITLLTCLVRLPTVFVTAAMGAGVLLLTWWQLLALLGGFGLLFVLFIRYQEPLLAWVDRRVEQYFS